METPIPEASAGDNEEPGVVSLRVLLASAERVSAWLRDRAWVIPVVSAVAGFCLYAAAVRYYDSVFRELGVPGLPVRVDHTQALARAAVGAVILVSFLLMAVLAYEATRVCFLERSFRWVPIALFSVTPFTVGLAQGVGPGGVAIGLDLAAIGIINLAPCVVGAVIGARSGRQARTVSDPVETEDRSEPLPPSPTIGRRLSFGWIPVTISIIVVSSLAQVDRMARADVAAIRGGGRQDDISALFAPLDVRRVRVSWKDPPIGGNRAQLPDEPIVLVGEDNGRVVAVAADGRLIDVPSADIVVTTP